MKTKKKEKSLAEGSTDIECVIHDHTLFFDKLIDLIPAKFYLPADEDKPWFHGLSKAAKANKKKQTKENIMKSRRDRLDPDKPPTTTLDLLKQSLGKEKTNDKEKLQGDDRSATYEQLRQRLHRKLEEFRADRICANPEEKAKKREDRDARRGYLDKKRKRDDGIEESKSAPDELAEKVKQDAAEASKELVFGHVKLTNDQVQGKKRKVSKHKELERAKRLEDEKKKDPEKGEAIAKKESWKAAMSRASGVKVHDDPKLIQKSIQKGKKRQQKNAEKWNDRIQTRDQLKAEKQKKRSDNLAERSHQKKMRKIAKREKKLLRPGFEGRKEGFINDGSG